MFSSFRWNSEKLVGFLKRLIGTHSKKKLTNFMRNRRRRLFQLELLEDRRPMAFNVTDVTLTEGTPTRIKDTLVPGTEAALYRIDGAAGQTIRFDSIQVSSSSGSWSLYSPTGQVLYGAGLESDFDAFLPTTGSYLLSLSSSADSPVTYDFAVQNRTDYLPTSSGLGVVHTGSLAANASQSFSFTGYAGQKILLDNQTDLTTPINFELLILARM